VQGSFGDVDPRRLVISSRFYTTEPLVKIVAMRYAYKRTRDRDQICRRPVAAAGFEGVVDRETVCGLAMSGLGGSVSWWLVQVVA